MMIPCSNFSVSCGQIYTSSNTILLSIQFAVSSFPQLLKSGVFVLHYLVPRLRRKANNLIVDGAVFITSKISQITLKPNYKHSLSGGMCCNHSSTSNETIQQ